ncbi:MAG: right-handed parallel beta-helix repeat-containing protein, partial [Synergistes sp.]|nr:right-handed parallel beta-helix repeat-containing protein [Synergistes sp.]
MKQKTAGYFGILSALLLAFGCAGAEGASFSDLQALIDAAPEGGSITLADDYSYEAAEDTALSEGVTISKPLTLDGSGHSISGAGMARCINISGVTEGGAKVLLKDLTITEGGGEHIASGGGAYIGEGSKAAFEDCRIIKNGTVAGVHTEQGGAALFVEPKAFVTFENCTIAENVGKDRSGGLYLKGSAVLTSCDIRDNKSGSRGGGIYVDPGKGDKRGGEWGGNIKMYKCTVSGHKGGRGGGAYINSENDRENYFEDCTFIDNDVTANSLGYGGGILFYSSVAKMVRCRVIDNKANRGGGVILDVAAKLTLEDCTISGNEATADGAGLYAFDGSHDDNVMKTIGEAAFKECEIKDNFVVSGDEKTAQDININYTDEETAGTRRQVNKGLYPPDGM